MEVMVHWVIQANIFGYETESLIKHCKSYELVHGSVYGFMEPGPYIIRGSINFVQETCNRWDDAQIPDLLHLPDFECSSYYLEIKDLLNKDFLLLPWWKLSSDKERLFEYFETDKLFIRPNSGRKLFTGTTVGYKWFTKELDIIYELPSSKFDQQEIVLIAKAQEVWGEARFLMQGKKIISYSLVDDTYGFDGVNISEYRPLAESNTYFPDTFYTIDIGMTREGPRIIELNSFVSAGLYNMDYEKVTKAVEDYYGA